MSILPDSLGDLIQVAIRDLETCEADPNYRVVPSDLVGDHFWCGRILGASKRQVSIGGCVMVQTLKAPSRSTPWPGRFDKETAEKLRSLEVILRLSNGGDCYYLTHYNPYKVFLSRYKRFKLVESQVIQMGHVFSPLYSEDPSEFKVRMAKLAELLNHYEVTYRPNLLGQARRTLYWRLGNECITRQNR